MARRAPLCLNCALVVEKIRPVFSAISQRYPFGSAQRAHVRAENGYLPYGPHANNDASLGENKISAARSPASRRRGLAAAMFAITIGRASFTQEQSRGLPRQHEQGDGAHSANGDYLPQTVRPGRWSNRCIADGGGNGRAEGAGRERHGELRQLLTQGRRDGTHLADAGIRARPGHQHGQSCLGHGRTEHRSGASCRRARATAGSIDVSRGQRFPRRAPTSRRREQHFTRFLDLRQCRRRSLCRRSARLARPDLTL